MTAAESSNKRQKKTVDGATATDARGGLRFGADAVDDAYAGEVGYGGTDEYTTTEFMEEEDDVDEGRQAATHPSTLQRNMVRNIPNKKLQTVH